MIFNPKQLADQLFDLGDLISADTVEPIIANLDQNQRGLVIKELEAKKNVSGMTTSQEQDYWRNQASGNSLSMDAYHDNEFRHSDNPQADEIHAKCDQLIEFINTLNQ